MKNFAYSILFLLLSTGCKNDSELNSIFNCNVRPTEETKKVIDFKKNFSIDIPTAWKTAMYFDEFQSEIFTADTVKQLSDTFILDASFNFGSLDFDPDFHKKTDSLLAKNNFQKINEGTLSFQSKPAYWYLLKGTKKGFTYHQLNLLVIISKTTYFKAYTDIYGDENIDARICSSISKLEKIEFLQ
jgi:hypothetical protein